MNGEMPQPQSEAQIREQEIEFLFDFIRPIISNNLIWTRALISSIVHNIGDVGILTNLLFGNAERFEALIENFYGPETAQRIAGLFSQLLSITVDLINNIKNRNINVIGSLRNSWLQTSRQINDAFVSVNPIWKSKEWLQAFEDYLNIIVNLTTYQVNSQYEAVAKEILKSEDNARQITQLLTEAIYNQFYL